jgi:hypothetical protein
VPESKLAKNRVHIDLVDPDQDAVSNEFCIAARSFTGSD